MVKAILLTLGKSALVDDGDYNTINQFKWHASKDRNTWYALTARKIPKTKENNMRRQESIRMHRMILCAPSDMQVDHINGNGLDNRRENLRLVSHRGNTQNRRHIKKTSVYPGVCWSNKSQKWRATINHGKKQKHLGYFDDEHSAYNRYLKEIPNSEEVVSLRSEARK